MTIDLSGKAALVTGAGSGIGRATAVVLAGYGAKVALAGRRSEPLEETARLVREAGGEALVARTDVAVWNDVRTLVARTVEDLGSLDIACNNAATLGAIKPLAELEAGDVDAALGTNLRGVLLCLRHEIAAMSTQGSGSVVNISSVNAARASANAGLYCASKAAVDMVTQVAALETAGTGIRVNSVRPGYVLTPMHDTVLELAGGATDATVAAVEASVPLRRRARPEEIAEAVAWLASDDAAYVTGTTLTVDGGVAIT